MAKKQAASSKKKATGEKKAFVVTGSGSRSIHEVAKDLKAAGFEVGQVLDSIGSVTGFAPAKITKQLRSIRGVADVSEDHPVDIGPPGAPIS
jgi:hypothetical protein